MVNAGKMVNSAGTVMKALLGLGLVGLLFLIIYGNLSGNLGFVDDSLSFDNETILLVDDGIGNAPANASIRSTPVLSSLTITNATGGETLETGNFTTSTSFVLGTSASEYNNTNVNVSYTVTFDSSGRVNTNAVINNLTGGVLTFFSFSNTFFTLTAITLLIAIVLIVINLVGGRKDDGDDSPSFSG